MALSGSFSSFPVSDLGLYCTWTAEQNAAGNYSDITLKVYLQYRTLNVGQITGSTISINGVSETFATPAIHDTTGGMKTRLIKTKTVRVQHDEGGFKTSIALTAYWPCDISLHGTAVAAITATDTIALDPIDRKGPAITLSVVSVTETAVTLKAAANAACDTWKYERDNSGTWSAVTGDGTEVTFTVSGLSVDRSYYFRVQARKKLNLVEGVSAQFSVTTTNVSKLNSCANITADAATVRFNVNATVNNSSCTHKVDILKNSTVVVTVSSLSWSQGTSSRTVTLSARQKSDLQAAMSGVKLMPVTVRLTSYSGKTQMGSPTTVDTEAITTYTNSAPTIEGMTLTDEEQYTSMMTHEEVFVQYASQLLVTPGRTAARSGAEITKYAVYCGNKYVENMDGRSPLMIGSIEESGSVEVRLIVTDSRGYTATLSQTITVLPLSDPVLTGFSLVRNATEPTNVNMDFTGEICSAVCGSEMNGIAYIQYRIKQTNTDTYGEYVSLLRDITLTGTDFSLEDYVIDHVDDDKSYDLHLQVIDNFGRQLDRYAVIPKAKPVVSLRDGMVGINKAEPSVALDVDGGASFSGEVKATSFAGSIAPANLASAVTVSKGGTGSTTAAGARSSLGIKGTSLYNSTLTTGSTTFSYSNYNAYAIIGTTAGSTVRCAILVPKVALTTSAVTYCISDGTARQEFTLKYSGSTVTLTMGIGGGSILRIIGIN
ncbi:MAG: hypothetical protein IKI64_07070 [Clostridia bacterium]|nr:hypothetical protein [Clostridia bacterium]